MKRLFGFVLFVLLMAAPQDVKSQDPQFSQFYAAPLYLNPGFAGTTPYIRAGANFASSPSRVNIHALDPVYIVAKISFTPFMERINVWEVLRNTLTREKGLGGIETRGVLRIGMPYKSN